MNKKASLGGIVFLVFIVAIIGIYVFVNYSSVEHTTITIKDKERITSGQDSYYLVYTEDEVFKNIDSLFFTKFDSSDVYRKLDVGKTYNVKVNWFRIPLFSMYRNILEVNVVEVKDAN